MKMVVELGTMVQPLFWRKSAVLLVPTGRFGENGWPWSFFVLLVSSVDPGFRMFEFFENGGASWRLFALGGFLTVFWDFFDTHSNTSLPQSLFCASFFLSHRAPFLPGCRPFDSLMLKKGVTVRVSQTKIVFSVLCAYFLRISMSNQWSVSTKCLPVSESFCLVMWLLFSCS